MFRTLSTSNSPCRLASMPVHARARSAWRRESGTPSDCKHPSAPAQHDRIVTHVARRVWGRIELNRAWERTKMTKIMLKLLYLTAVQDEPNDCEGARATAAKHERVSQPVRRRGGWWWWVLVQWWVVGGGWCGGHERASQPAPPGSMAGGGRRWSEHVWKIREAVPGSTRASQRDGRTGEQANRRTACQDPYSDRA